MPPKRTSSKAGNSHGAERQKNARIQASTGLPGSTTSSSGDDASASSNASAPSGANVAQTTFTGTPVPAIVAPAMTYAVPNSNMVADYDRFTPPPQAHSDGGMSIVSDDNLLDRANEFLTPRAPPLVTPWAPIMQRALYEKPRPNAVVPSEDDIMRSRGSPVRALRRPFRPILRGRLLRRSIMAAAVAAPVSDDTDVSELDSDDRPLRRKAAVAPVSNDADESESSSDPSKGRGLRRGKRAVQAADVERASADHVDGHVDDEAAMADDGKTSAEVEINAQANAEKRQAVADRVASDLGSPVELNLRAVLEYMFAVLLIWVELNSSEEIFGVLHSFGPSGLAELAISGIQEASPELLDYLSECIERGVPHDMRKVEDILETIPIESAMFRHGLYLVLLMKGDTTFAYGGSSVRMMKKMMYSRLQEHLSPSHRARYSEKQLYKGWHESTPVIIRPILLLPKTHVATHGSAPCLAIEQVVTLLLCGWHTRSTASASLDMGLVFPPSLMTAFDSYCRNNGCSDIDNVSNIRLMHRALSSAASGLVRGTNWSPTLLYGSGGRRAAPHIMLLEGLLRTLMFRDNLRTAARFMIGEVQFTVSKSQMDAMVARGFSPDRPYVYIVLSRSDDYDPENWARVRQDEDREPMIEAGSECASRIRMTITWVCDDGLTQDQALRYDTKNGKSRHALERVCLINTLYEYASDLLPVDDGPEHNGRSRRDIYTNVNDQGRKIWHIGQPERDAFDSVSEIECNNCGRRFESLRQLKVQHRNTHPECKAAHVEHEKAVAQWKEDGKNIFRCPNGDECVSRTPYECQSFSHISQHLCVDGKLTKCGRKLGLSGVDAKSIKEESFRYFWDSVIPGAPVGDLQVTQYINAGKQTTSSNCKFRCKCCNLMCETWNEMVAHLCLHSTKKCTREMTDRIEKCRKAFGLTKDSLLADFDREDAVNPDFQG
jgi:hypothetical protein